MQHKLIQLLGQARKNIDKNSDRSIDYIEGFDLAVDFVKIHFKRNPVQYNYGILNLKLQKELEDLSYEFKEYKRKRATHVKQLESMIEKRDKKIAAQALQLQEFNLTFLKRKSKK